MSGDASGQEERKGTSNRQQEARTEHGGATAGGDESGEALQAWTVFSATLFAIAGFAVGVLVILVNAVDESLLELDVQGAPDGGGAPEVGAEFANFFAVIFTYPLLVFLAGLAVFVGAGLAYRGVPDGDTFQVAAVSAAAGAALFLIVSVILVSTTLDGLSVNFVGLLINSVLAAAVAAGAAAGGVWTARNQSPST